jgi:hypothetical protein
MSDKKRTTVTTIETHEIWIIRRAVPELLDVEVITLDEIAEPAPVSHSDEGSSSLETSEEQRP